MMNAMSQSGGNENVQAINMPAWRGVSTPFFIPLIITVAISGVPINKHSAINCSNGDMRNVRQSV
jgi:hypothetical protein